MVDPSFKQSQQQQQQHQIVKKGPNPYPSLLNTFSRTKNSLPLIVANDDNNDDEISDFENDDELLFEDEEEKEEKSDSKVPTTPEVMELMAKLDQKAVCDFNDSPYVISFFNWCRNFHAKLTIILLYRENRNRFAGGPDWEGVVAFYSIVRYNHTIKSTTYKRRHPIIIAMHPFLLLTSSCMTPYHPPSQQLPHIITVLD